MTNLPGSPRIVHGGFVIIGPHSLQPARIIPFQYNPETLSRTLSPGAPATSGSTGPSGTAGVASLGTALGPVAALGTLLGTGAEQPSADRGTVPAQLIEFSLALDATDQLQFPAQNRVAVQYGVYPLLSAIEDLLYLPQSSPNTLTLFVWGANRVLPVRFLRLQITEQMFDPALNPIQVGVQVTLQVLSDADFPKNSPFRKYWEEYLSHLETLAALFPNGSLSDLGLTSLP
jgi:hypothetical protein